ncbi:NAD-dependent epimerase/dehydratase family protein [Acidobacteria bacterium AH-259-L09]|nr:NAD-dependent epimerase/dehydratase family protein [Acidobacteria bacterium AH-259-L09]
MPIPGFENTTALVTGGAGFIGSHLVEALVERGAKVRILDNLATGSSDNLAHCIHRIEFVKGDILDKEVCRRVCQNVVYIFHQAALTSVLRSIEDPANAISVNVAGTANIFAAGRDARVRRIIYASSSSVYGDSKILPKREGEEGRPLSPYALSKLMNEQLAEIFAGSYDMELIGLRYFNVYGPRQDPDRTYAAVIPRFFKAFGEGDNPEIYGDGEQTRDFTFVKDAVAANLLAAGASKVACGHAYNVGVGSATSINQLAAKVGELMGRSCAPLYLPPRPGDVRVSLAGIEQIKKSLGYEPAYDLAKGLAELFSQVA